MIISGQDRTGREYQLDIMVLWSPPRRVIVKFKCRIYFYRDQKILRKNWINHDMTVPETEKSIFNLDGRKISRRQRCACALLDDPSQQGDRCLFRPLNSSFCVLPWSPPLCLDGLPRHYGTMPSLRHPYHYDHGVVGQGEQIIMGCTSKNTDRRLPKSLARRQSHG